MQYKTPLLEVREIRQINNGDNYPPKEVNVFNLKCTLLVFRSNEHVTINPLNIYRSNTARNYVHWQILYLYFLLVRSNASQ